jgi:phosphoribosylglycinamide formyltransferase-1
MLKIGVLISGRGSNLQALIDKTKDPDYPVKIACVISNKPGVEGLRRAQDAGIQTFVVDHKKFSDKTSFETALDQKLTSCHVELVCLAGFMRVLTSFFVDRWLDRLINIHPSLLPSFPGLETHEKAIESGVKFAGCTVHFVRTALDHGPIIAQAVVPVMDEDDAESLAARVLKAEHQIYPDVVRWIAEKRVNVLNEKVFVIDTLLPRDFLINPLDDQALAKK